MRILLIIITCLSFATMKAQDLKTHQWKNRVLLVISKSDNSELYKNQIKILDNNEDAFIDRKLLIYNVLPNQYKIGHSKWLTSYILFDKYMTKEDNFKVILIGLDGGIKLTQDQILTTKKLFSTIDVMPMRQS